MFENRRFERIPEHLALSYTILLLGNYPETPVDKQAAVESENISEGGILFLTNELIPLGSILELEIKLAGEELPMFLKARVVRIEELGPEKYDIGIMFIGVTQDDQVTLRRFVDERKAT